MKETIVIEKNGKFGPLVDGKYYSFSKFYKGPKEFAVGSSVEVDVFEAESGKKYINGVAGDVAVAAKTFKAVVKPVVTTDWAAKDRSQLVGGRSHDAVELVNTSLVTGTDLPKVLELYKQALEGVLRIAEEVK